MTKKTTFYVKLIEFRTNKKRNARGTITWTLLDKEYLSRQFSHQSPEEKEKKGCYVWGIRSGRGLAPFYVGKTTAKKGFSTECFTEATINKAIRGAYGYDKGTVILALIPLKKITRGRPNSKVIKHLENTLIKLASFKNPYLANTQGVKDDPWEIEGVTDNKRKRPPKDASAFRKLIFS